MPQTTRRHSLRHAVVVENEVVRLVSLFLTPLEIYSVLLCCRQWSLSFDESFWQMYANIHYSKDLEFRRTEWTWKKFVRRCCYYKFSDTFKSKDLVVEGPLHHVVSNPTESTSLLVRLDKPIPLRDTTIRFNVRVERGNLYNVGYTAIGIVTSHALNNEKFDWSAQHFVGAFDLPRQPKNLSIGYCDYGYLQMMGKGACVDQVGAYHDLGIEVNFKQPKPTTREFLQMQNNGKFNEFTYRSQKVVFGTNHDPENTGTFV